MGVLDDFCNDSEGWGPVNDDSNDLTLCAQSCIITFPICFLMILGCIGLMFHLRKRAQMISLDEQNKRQTLIASLSTKLESSVNPNSMCTIEMTTSFGITLCLSYGIITALTVASRDNKSHNWIILTLVSEFLAWLAISMTYYMEYKYMRAWGDTVTPSRTVRLFWLVQACIGIKTFEALAIRESDKNHDNSDENSFEFWFSLLFCIVSVILGIRATIMTPRLGVLLIKENKQRMEKYEKMIDKLQIDDETDGKNKGDNYGGIRLACTVEDKANLIQWLGFGWLDEVLKQGYARPLQMMDLHFLRAPDVTSALLESFFGVWQRQLDKVGINFLPKAARRQKNLKNNYINLDEDDSQSSSQEYDNQPPQPHQQPTKRGGDVSVTNSSKSGQSQQGNGDGNGKGNRRSKEEHKTSIAKAMTQAFGWDFVFSLPLKIIYDVTQFGGPLYLSLFLTYAETFGDNHKSNEKRTKAQNKAYVIAGLMFVTYTFGTFIYHQFYHYTFTMGMRARGTLVGACYDKCLKLSLGARKERSTGQVMTMVSVDVQKVRDVFPFFWFLIAAPIQIIICIYLLYVQINWAVFAGIGVQLFVLIPFQACVANQGRKLQNKVMGIRDERVKITNELFSSMKIVKMYAWELSMGEKIDNIRQNELKIFGKYVGWSIGMSFMFAFAPQLISLTAFFTYTAAGNDLTASKAFTTIALFNVLRFPLAFLPQVILSCIESNVSLGRINSFLCANESDPQTIEYFESKSLQGGNNNNNNNHLVLMQHERVESKDERENKNDNDDGGGEVLIRLDNCSFAWDDSGHQLALSNINCVFPQGSMTMIIGQTGSGKSSLLRSLLGNLNKVEGKLLYNRKITEKGIAYSSQVAWIQNQTLKNNVLFGKPYKKEFYDAVIHACALTDDLKVLTAGDETEIGEKGINISGGQKQRISLARACYSDSDLYVFDDCLSAVDSHVANHIFTNCFMNILRKRGKTIIFATHTLAFLRYADNIIVMNNDGAIEMQGKLKDLQDAKINLVKYVIKRKKKKKKTGADDNDETSSNERDENESGDLSIDDLNLDLNSNESQNEIGTLETDKNVTTSVVGAGGANETITTEKNEENKDKDSNDVDIENEEKLQHTPKQLMSSPRVPPISKHASGNRTLEESIATLEHSLMQNMSKSAEKLEKKHRAKRHEAKKLVRGKSDGDGGGDDNMKKGQLVKEEERGVGDISFAIYWSYLEAAGGFWMSMGILFGIIFFYGGVVGANFWLAVWSDDTDSNPKHNAWYYLGYYAVIQFADLFFLLFALILVLFARIRASRVVHANLLDHMLHAPMQFFDQTPIGRIINRFSKDIYAIDQAVPFSMRLFVQFTTFCIGVILSVVIVTPYFIIIIVPVVLFYYYIQKYFITTARELRRISSLKNSPIYSHFNETIEGYLTILSFGKGKEFDSKNKHLIDSDHDAYYPSIAINRWLAVRLEMLGNVMIGFAAFSCVFSRPSAGFVGVAMSMIMSVTQILNFCIRQKAELEQNVVSIERIQQYNQVETEAPYNIKETQPRNPNWPDMGKIEFKNVYMKYRPELPHVLKGLTFTINGGEKVGVIGRTGAGKSSLFLTLLRLIEIDNSVVNMRAVRARAEKIRLARERELQEGHGTGGTSPNKLVGTASEYDSAISAMLVDNDYQSTSFRNDINDEDSSQFENAIEKYGMGSIIIDDINISDLGLQDLRSRLSVIPQDPVLFTGSVRFNLDPFNQHNDDEIIDALKLAHCWTVLKKMAVSLAIKRERDAKDKENEEKEKGKGKGKGKIDRKQSSSGSGSGSGRGGGRGRHTKSKGRKIKKPNQEQKMRLLSTTTSVASYGSRPSKSKSKRETSATQYGLAASKSTADDFHLLDDESNSGDDGDRDTDADINTNTDRNRAYTPIDGKIDENEEDDGFGNINVENENEDRKIDEIIASMLSSKIYNKKDLDPLSIEIEENGSNFSVGQRQLLCLARAIVRKSQILLLDEATSAVDPQTDHLIQNTIRKVFSQNTILTIAHRIDTILDYDKILIMDNGVVLEYDKVENLLNNSQSKFAEIVETSFGVSLEDVLKVRDSKGFNAQPGQGMLQPQGVKVVSPFSSAQHNDENNENDSNDSNADNSGGNIFEA